MNLNYGKIFAYLNKEFVCFHDDPVQNVEFIGFFGRQSVFRCTTKSSKIIQKYVFTNILNYLLKLEILKKLS